MKKNIILILTIFLIIIGIIAYGLYHQRIVIVQSSQNNRTYESFYNQNVLGTDFVSLINKAIDNNEKNLVIKDENGNYIDNEKNSIKVEVKFQELDKVVKMEAINKQGVHQFLQNFGATSFKCTKIEYHQSTKNVKYMYFEQI